MFVKELKTAANAGERGSAEHSATSGKGKISAASSYSEQFEQSWARPVVHGACRLSDEESSPGTSPGTVEDRGVASAA